jgi:hypothetical protein
MKHKTWCNWKINMRKFNVPVNSHQMHTNGGLKYCKHICLIPWAMDKKLLEGNRIRHRYWRDPSLGLATKVTKVKGLQGWRPKGSPRVTPHAPGSAKEWGEMNPHTPKGVQPWELESQCTLESSEGDFRGQNSMDGRLFYIIKKLLERRCLKSARTVIWTSKTYVMGKRRVGS